jgi:hypothetical protein
VRGVDPIVARKTWRTAEPVHGVVYFARERLDAYERIGVSSDAGYFVTRAAAMGAVDASVVVAAFFNFNPAFVERCMAGAWAATTPSAAVAARLDAVDAMLRRLLGDDVVRSPEVHEAAELARRCAMAAAERPEGRPLFAGHAALAWPHEPHLVLWHAQTLLRELRGDGHVAAMTVEGVRGCEALAIHAGTGDIAAEALRTSRQWSHDEWSAACDSLRSRGWLDGDGALTEAGRAHRQWVEDRTDALAVGAYEAIGEDGCERLRALVRPLSQAIVSSGELTLGLPRS